MSLTGSDAPTGASSMQVRAHTKNAASVSVLAIAALTRSCLAIAGLDGVKILGANGCFVEIVSSVTRVDAHLWDD